MSLFDQTNKSKSDSKRFLEFFLGADSYAVELLHVKEVITPPDTTPIPKSPAYVCGLMNLRGLVLTVVDLRKKLGIVPGKDNSQSAVIIFDLNDRLVGVIVDSIQRVLNVQQEKIRPVPDANGAGTTHLLGIIQQEDKLTMWLDPASALDPQLAKSA